MEFRDGRFEFYFFYDIMCGFKRKKVVAFCFSIFYINFAEVYRGFRLDRVCF